MISFRGGPHIAVHGTIIIMALAFAVLMVLMGAPPAIRLTLLNTVMALALAGKPLVSLAATEQTTATNRINMGKKRFISTSFFTNII